MNKTVGILFILLVLGGVSYIVMQKKAPIIVPTEEAIVQDGPGPNDGYDPGVEVVEGTSFKFVPNQIRVKKGVASTILFKNMEGMHDFVVDELNIKTKLLQAGTEESVTFTADAVGSYEFYCSVGNHRAMGMTGTIIVE